MTRTRAVLLIGPVLVAVFLMTAPLAAATPGWAVGRWHASLSQRGLRQVSMSIHSASANHTAGWMHFKLSGGYTACRATLMFVGEQDGDAEFVIRFKRTKSKSAKSYCQPRRKGVHFDFDDTHWGVFTNLLGPDQTWGRMFSPSR